MKAVNKLILLTVFLGACTATPIKIDPPKLDLPPREPLALSPVDWSIITKETCAKILSSLEESGLNPSLVCVHPDSGYTNLSNNMLEIQVFIEQLIAENKLLRDFYENQINSSN